MSRSVFIGNRRFNLKQKYRAQKIACKMIVTTYHLVIRAFDHKNHLIVISGTIPNCIHLLYISICYIRSIRLGSPLKKKYKDFGKHHLRVLII